MMIHHWILGVFREFSDAPYFNLYIYIYTHIDFMVLVGSLKLGVFSVRPGDFSVEMLGGCPSFLAGGWRSSPKDGMQTISINGWWVVWEFHDIGGLYFFHYFSIYLSFGGYFSGIS